MKYTAAALALPLVLAACAGSPMRLESASPEELQTMHPNAVCNAYAFGRSPKLRTAVEDMKLVAPEHMEDVARGTVGIGYTELELICARGFPQRINESGSRRGIRKQWVYETPALHGYSRRYFYTDGNEVTGWN